MTRKSRQPERDESQAALDAVNEVTGSGAVKGEDLLNDPKLKAAYLAAKERMKPTKDEQFKKLAELVLLMDERLHSTSAIITKLLERLADLGMDFDRANALRSDVEQLDAVAKHAAEDRKRLREYFGLPPDETDE